MRLCVADDGAGMVWELEPAGPRGAPEVVRYSAPVPGIVDCAYDADGTLKVLAQNPARLLERPAGDDFADLQTGAPLAPNPEPMELIRDAEGGVEVRRRGDGLRGKAYLPDGRALTIAEDDTLLSVDGAPVLSVGLATYDDKGPRAARVAMAVRPDGLVVVTAHHAPQVPPYGTLGYTLAVDLATGTAWNLGADGFDAALGVGLVRVPGGVAADPWTGAAVGDAPRVVPADVEPPTVPLPPSGGEKIETVTEGCSATRSPRSPLAPLVILGLFAICRARIRRRR
jgi:hypothetical protein